ncbi:MAG: dihydrodipicolinate synthase family protein [Armatimonadota bacterium]
MDSRQKQKAEVWPVMLTPFTDSLEIDWNGVDALVDWYIANGADGIFTVCLTSEMYHLTPDERLSLAARVVKCANDKIPVIASGTFGGSIASQADYVKQMYDTGVKAVVVVASELADLEADEFEWLLVLDKLLSQTKDIPLGVYECPVPYHRLLSPEVVKSLAETERFIIYKDTSCRMNDIRTKISAASGSSLKWMNANAPTMLESLQAGGGGFMGIAANFLLNHFVWLCKNFEDRPEESASLQRYLSIADMVVRNKYPTSAKLFLSSLGVPIKSVCRNQNHVLSEEELIVLKHLKESSYDIYEKL